MVKAPQGSKISCKGWIQEAALRMLMNNLDPEVAELPEELIVYGGRGKAARNPECYDVNSLVDKAFIKIEKHGRITRLYPLYYT